MTCQHCQTWVLDDDHRCRRCGRRVRTAPSRISPDTYPIAATATALAYDFAAQVEPAPAATDAPPQPGQQPLFPAAAVDPRVIPFESLTTQTERESIRSRAADLLRPPPIKTAKVEVRHARRRKDGTDQQRLEFFGHQEIPGTHESQVTGNVPVAPRGLRVHAACIDALWMALGSAFGLIAYAYAGGEFSLDKHVLPFLAVAVLTVPVFYKLLWAIAGCDSVGMASAGLRLVNFDGNPPSPERRYQRLFGSFISLLAGGIGMVWALVDEDCLTWHDHISSTFPTLASDE